jgi:hypothetical protein
MKVLDQFVNLIFTVMRDSPAPPEDFIKAFEQSRRIVLSHSIVVLQAAG